MHAKLRSAISRLGGADAIVMQSIVGKELAQGRYVAVRTRIEIAAGFEPATLRTKAEESTNEQPRPTMSHHAPHPHFTDIGENFWSLTYFMDGTY